MIVLNVTTKIIADIRQRWLLWMKTECFSLLQQSFIHHYKLYLLMDDDEEPTYVLQIFFINMENYEAYLSVLSAVIYNEQQLMFNGSYVNFETLMKEVE